MSDVEAESPSVKATPTWECLARIPFLLVFLALAFLDRAYDKRFVVPPAPFATCATSYPSLVNFNREVSSDAVAIWAHHRPTELVQYLEGRLIALEAELPLKLHSTQAGRLTRHKVSGPKPDRDWRVRPLHNRVGHKRRVTFAAATSEHDGGAVREAARLALPPAETAREAFGPPHLLQMRRTRRVIREKPNEVRERRRERDRGGQSAKTVADSPLGINRISMVRTSRPRGKQGKR